MKSCPICGVDIQSATFLNHEPSIAPGEQFGILGPHDRYRVDPCGHVLVIYRGRPTDVPGG